MKKILSKGMSTKKKTAKISRIAKAWRAYSRNRENREKLMDFYETFLNTQFWLKLDEGEEKNYAKFKKSGIMSGEKFKIAVDENGVALLFELLSEHKKFAEKGLVRGQKIKYCSIKQHGGELIYNLSKNTEYAIKLKGVKDFIRITSESVRFMKKNFKQ